MASNSPPWAVARRSSVVTSNGSCRAGSARATLSLRSAGRLPIPPEATLKIREIRAAPVDLTPRPTTVPPVPRQAADGFVSPMRRYNEYRRAGGEGPLDAAAAVVAREGRAAERGGQNHARPVAGHV